MGAYSQKIIYSLLAEADSASTADEKGEKLEELARYLFEKISGISFYAGDFLDSNRAHEIDLAFWNAQKLSGIAFLDPVLILECKHTATAVSSADVGWFVRKLQDRGASCGILIALSGITGSADGTSNAHSEVLSALVRDKIKILVIKRVEIESLKKTDDLVALLKEKLLRLTLYKIAV